MSMIEGLRNWVKGYDSLAQERIGVDNLDSGIGTFAIATNGAPETVSEFMFARTRRQAYYLMSDCAYGTEPLQNMDNLEWYEDFARWVYDKNFRREFPSLGEHITCVGIADTTKGELFGVTEDGHAFYRLQLTVEYTESLF